MKCLLLTLLVFMATAAADHLQVGNIANQVVMAHHKKVQYNAIPFVKRVKYLFYTSPDNRIIEGIQALDELQSKASVNITAGGPGYSYVNLRMKSERGRGLAYDVSIYMHDFFYRTNM